MTQVQGTTNQEDMQVGSALTADVEVHDSLTKYGEDVLTTKIPHFADGCKAVVRRILWFNRDELKLRPMNKMVGDLQDVHTGGDASIADAVLRLGQDFNVGIPLIEISGKSGEYYNQDAAAATRYLDAALSEFSYDVYFRKVNTESLSMMPTKNANNEEPRYMVPKIPMALVLGNLTVGMAFKSQIPMIDLHQICDLVMVYAKQFQTGIKTKLPPPSSTAKLLLPGFPIKNIILNRKELVQAYSNGIYAHPIKLEGWIDLSGNSITLRNLPYGNNFGKVTNNFRQLLRNTKNQKTKFHAVIDSANDYSSDETEFTISIKSGKNPFEVLDLIRTQLNIDDTFHPIFNYVKNERVVSLTPPTLTYLWYHEREANIASGLNRRQSRINAELMKRTAILLVIDRSDEVIEICKNSNGDADTIENLYNHFADIALTRNQAIIVAHQPLSIFNKNAKPRILAERDQLIIDLENVKNEFNKIDETIANEAAYIQKRYGHTSKTLYSDDFIGHVQFGNWGLINFFDYDEMKSILSTGGWPSNMVKSITLYDKKRPRKRIIIGGKVIDPKYITKEMTCERMVCYPASVNDEMTLVISDSGSVSVIEHLVSAVKDGYTLCPISKRFYAIHRDGSITLENYRDHSIRKTISSGRKSTIIYGFPDSTKDVLLFHMNPSDPNNLRVSRILHSAGAQHKIKFAMGGETRILGIHSIKNNDIVINIPKDCTKGIRISHLFIHNGANLFKSGKTDFAIINLTRGKNSAGVKLKPDNIVNTMFHLNFSSSEE